MAEKLITSGIHYIGVSHYDRRFFDALVPTPEGTTYNAYLVEGKERNALIDTVEPEFKELFLRNLKATGVERIDYVVSNHAEQDHSGCIPDILALYPECKLVTNEKCSGMLRDLMPEIPVDRIVVIKDRETLDLGGRTLEFILAPWVHWPETMFTLLQEDQILFTCDFFGSHLATSNLFLDDQRLFFEPMKRYYAQIMMPYRGQALKRLETVKTLDLKMICPSHGPAFKDPALPLSLYSEWTSDTPKNAVLIPWISTHGATARMVDHLTNALVLKGITVYPHNLLVADSGRIAGNLVDVATIAVGTSCLLSAAHPLAAYAALLTNALKPKAKFATVFGSYGWSGVKVPEQILGLLGGLKLEVIPPVQVKGAPSTETFAALDQMAEEIFSRHASLGLK
ncbi:MAG: FprA family A-type flavoprotein [Limisphaerales bacterium]|jgi:flavorubredoxin|nr:FprA family A-type flavoprotein [Verrucomicrobiota bacterium]